MAKQIVTTETKQYGSFTVSPNVTGMTVWFNVSNRGGVARYDLNKGEFLNCKGRVGKAMESWLEAQYIK